MRRQSTHGTANPRNRDSRRGTAIMEFALCFVLFVVVMLGITEFGRLLWSQVTLTNAVRQGARYARIHGEGNPATSDQIANVVSSKAVGIAPSALTTTVQWIPDNKRGSQVRIRTQYTHRSIAASLLSLSRDMKLESASTIMIGN